MYSIKEASQLTTIPSSTIRYYETIQLIPPIKRNKQGNRVLDNKDIEILRLILCFRKLGMSIQEIQLSLKQIELEDKNTNDILLAHQMKLEEQIHLLTSHIDDIQTKIAQRNEQ